MTHNDEADTLLIVYQRGFADGKRSAERKPLTEEPQVGPVEDMMLRRAALRSAKIVFGGRFVTKQAEPVAWMDREGDLYKMPEIKNWAPPHTMLYTTPPQRQWVGLTPEEILDLFDRNNVYGSKWIEFARTVETKLKDKNDH